MAKAEDQKKKFNSVKLERPIYLRLKENQALRGKSLTHQISEALDAWDELNKRKNK